MFLLIFWPGPLQTGIDPFSCKESQLKYRVDTLAFGCAFCYGIVIPCCLLYLYGKQHMVLEVNRTRTVTRWHWRWGCSFDFLPKKIIVPCDFSPAPRLMLGTRAICTCGSMTFSAPRPKRYQGRTISSCALWLQQHRHTSPCSIVDGCLGPKYVRNPQKQFRVSTVLAMRVTSQVNHRQLIFFSGEIWHHLQTVRRGSGSSCGWHSHSEATGHRWRQWPSRSGPFEFCPRRRCEAACEATESWTCKTDIQFSPEKLVFS